MFNKEPKIEELLLEELSNGQQSTLVLIDKLQKRKPNVTKQAIYKALRILKRNEVVIQNRMEVSLSSVWLKKMSDFIEKSEFNYKGADNPTLNFLNLKEGEKIAYSFKTFVATDFFWCHAFDVLSDILPKNSELLLYYPHEWFFLVRTESETYLFEKTLSLDKRIFCLVGNRDPLDIYSEKYFDTKNSHYFASKEVVSGMKENYYVNVFGNFLIEVWLDDEMSAALDNVYKNEKILTDEVKERISEIIKAPGKNKFVISRNTRKAQKLKKVFAKYFFIRND